MRCTAKSKQSGEQCKRHAVAGRSVCYIHGGASLSGIASPTFKEGKYSKVLPSRLLPSYEASKDDPRILELRDDISLVDARIGDLLARVDTGESGALWTALQAAYSDLKAAQNLTSPTERGIKMAVALGQMGDLITRGHEDYAAWREVGGVLDQRRRLVESERKRLVELQQTITADRALELMQALLLSVRAIISDRGQLQAIQDAFNRLTMAQETIIDQ